MLFVVIISKYCVNLVYLIRLKILTYTPCKKYFEIYTEIYGPIDVNSYQTEFARKDIILLSDVL